jgi:crotonobetainyl-CoA:carnitine CoA-transferase CaiB-like acyl-CoA transferase
VSMLESSISAMGWTVSNYTIGGEAPEPMGDQNATAAPSGTFDAADAPLNIAANRQEQYEVLCRLVERPDLLTDPRFATVDQRKRHREELNRELNKALGARSAQEWAELLPANGVPAARVLTVPEAVELEQLAHRGFFHDVSVPGLRPVRISGNGVLVDGERWPPADPPPRLGQHNDEIGRLIEEWEAGG